MSLSLAACLCVFTSCVAYHPSHRLCAISALCFLVFHLQLLPNAPA